MIYALAAAFLYLLYRNWALSRDIHRLYSSRDSIWKEFNNEVQARKRQTKELRQRTHENTQKLKSKISMRSLQADDLKRLYGES